MSHEENYGQRRYWPFEILPAEKRTEHHQQEIRFLETAQREGYAPYMCIAGRVEFVKGPDDVSD